MISKIKDITSACFVAVVVTLKAEGNSESFCCALYIIHICFGSNYVYKALQVNLPDSNHYRKLGKSKPRSHFLYLRLDRKWTCCVENRLTVLSHGPPKGLDFSLFIKLLFLSMIHLFLFPSILLMLSEQE